MNIFKGKGRGVKGELLPYENLQPLTKQDFLNNFLRSFVLATRDEASLM